MAEYITKEAAIEAVEDAGLELYQSEWNEIEEKINAIPTVDVVPVIRCKDCKYAYINPSGAILCSSSMQMKKQDGFCDYGDRNDGGTDIEIYG